MIIKVINLAKSDKRRASVLAQLTPFDFTFQFFEAIYGEAGYKYFEGCDTQVFRLNTGRNITPAEVGCYASHLLLWKLCVEKNTPILVLEDDFEVLSDFGEAVKITNTLVDEYGFIRMESNQRDDKTILERGEFKLNYCKKYSHCTTCYAISPRVAKIFVEQSKILKAPVDVFIKFYWNHKQPLYVLYPSAVKRGELALETDIQRANKIRSKIFLIKRALYKLKNIHCRLNFNRAFLKKLGV